MYGYCYVRPFTLSRPFTYSVTVHIAFVDIIIESSFIYFANAHSAILYVYSNSVLDSVSLLDLAGEDSAT